MHCYVDFICDRGIDPLVYTAVYLEHDSDSTTRLMQTDAARKFFERYCFIIVKIMLYC